jgi:hypothetical protein
VTGISSLTPEDLNRVRKRVEGGGRVIIAASHFMTGTVSEANKVMDGYGLRMADEESSSRVTVQKESLDIDLVRAGLDHVVHFRASPISIVDQKTARVIVKAVGAGQKDDGFVAVSKAGRGDIAAIGQSLWWHWISDEQANGADNAKLLRWLITRPKQ